MYKYIYIYIYWDMNHLSLRIIYSVVFHFSSMSIAILCIFHLVCHQMCELPNKQL